MKFINIRKNYTHSIKRDDFQDVILILTSYTLKEII